MKKQCSQEHLTPPKEGVREPKPLKKAPPESEERNWVDCAKVSHHEKVLKYALIVKLTMQRSPVVKMIVDGVTHLDSNLETYMNALCGEPGELTA
ncbi:MAG: hypothetical protein RL012_168 [Bacteroidota bacterium]